MNISQVLIKPVLTEKSVIHANLNKYTFVVHKNATKIDVKNALANLYGVKVKSINVLKNLPKYKFGKKRALIQKRAETRRAIVTLKDGEKLDLSKLKLGKVKTKKSAATKASAKTEPKKTTKSEPKKDK